MELLLNLIPFIVIPGVLGVFAYYYFGGKKIHPSEENLTPLFQEQAGGRFDGFNLTIPFVRHSIYENYVVIAYGKSHFKLNFDQVSKVEVKRHLFSKGITYHHNLNNVPFDCIVWSKKPDEVEKLLKNKGIKLVLDSSFKCNIT